MATCLAFPRPLSSLAKHPSELQTCHFLGFEHETHSFCSYFTPPATKAVSHHCFVKLLLLLRGCTWHGVPKDRKKQSTAMLVLEAVSTLHKAGTNFLWKPQKRQVCAQVLTQGSGCAPRLENLEVFLSFTVHM